MVDGYHCCCKIAIRKMFNQRRIGKCTKRLLFFSTVSMAIVISNNLVIIIIMTMILTDNNDCNYNIRPLCQHYLYEGLGNWHDHHVNHVDHVYQDHHNQHDHHIYHDDDHIDNDNDHGRLVDRAQLVVQSPSQIRC